MIKLPLIILRHEESTTFLSHFPENLPITGADLLNDYFEIHIDDSAKVERGFLTSAIALSHMGLFYDGNRLFLVDTDLCAMNVDLDQTFYNIALARGSDPLIKAVTVKGCKASETVVFDFSAGTLRDALHMVKSGFNVVAFERHLVVFLLLNAAIKNFFKHTNIKTVQLNLIFGDPSSMEHTNRAPDVVYFDPMFQGTLEKSAKPRKEMLLFHRLFLQNYALMDLFSQPKNDQDVLDYALNWAHKKVVVKRSPKAKPLLPPTFEFLSKTVRFDVYDVSFKKTK